MANVTYRKNAKGEPQKNTDGTLSFYFRVYLGRDIKGKQVVENGKWRAPVGMRFTTACNKAHKEALLFEYSLKRCQMVKDSKMRFEDYVKIFIEEFDLDDTTLAGYETLLKRIILALGHIPLGKLTPAHLKAFYNDLRQPDQNKNAKKAQATPFLCQTRKLIGLTQIELAELSTLSQQTIESAEAGHNITLSSATKIASALHSDITHLFDFTDENSHLSRNTIWHHHKLIATILSDAVANKLLNKNVAVEIKKAPKQIASQIKIMTDHEARRFVQLLLNETDIRKKAALLIAVFTGMRRGEVAGLSWSDIVYRDKQYFITVTRSSVYTKATGIK